MNNKEKIRRAGIAGMAAAGTVLRLSMEALSDKDRAFMGSMIKEGHSLELVYAGILGKDQHVRIMIIGPDGTPREMTRIALV